MQPENHFLFTPIAAELNFRQRFRASCVDQTPLSGHSLRHVRATPRAAFSQLLLPTPGSCEGSSLGLDRSECTGTPLIRP